MMRRTLPLLALAALLQTGCLGGGKAPVPTVWTLPTPRVASPGVDANGPSLGVEHFGSIAELRTTSLTYREGDGRQLKRYAYHQWSDYPDRMLYERLLAHLMTTRAFKSVTEAPPKRGLDGVLSLQLVEFDEWDDPSGVRVIVGLRWTLTNAEGEAIGSDLTRSEQDAAKSVEDVVKAYERATDEVLGHISSRVAGLLKD